MDVTPPKKRVWILGAGFSRSLGGPLIKDLLAFRQRELIESLLPPLPRSETRVELAARSVAVRGFYAWGQEEGHWEHAEEFLDKIETAWDDQKRQSGTQSHATLSLVPMLRGQAKWKHIPCDFGSLEDLLQTARRAVLLDCWSFLRGAREKLSPTDCPERWSPYFSWARNLGKNDTVVTFNYDALPEILKAADQEDVHLRVIPPKDAVREARMARERGNAPVLKLHGSTTWATRKTATPESVVPTTKVIPATEFVDTGAGIPLPFKEPDAEPLLGFPGPTKLRTCNDAFLPLWEIALEAIREATHVYFLGYRFPHTDTYALESLLEALASSISLKEVTTVLGPESADTRRMGNLLSVATFRGGVEHVSEYIYTTDFLLKHRIKTQPFGRR